MAYSENIEKALKLAGNRIVDPKLQGTLKRIIIALAGDDDSENTHPDDVNVPIYVVLPNMTFINASPELVKYEFTIGGQLFSKTLESNIDDPSNPDTYWVVNLPVGTEEVIIDMTNLGNSQISIYRQGNQLDPSQGIMPNETVQVLYTIDLTVYLSCT